VQPIEQGAAAKLYSEEREDVRRQTEHESAGGIDHQGQQKNLGHENKIGKGIWVN
jgi:hypothetical protein